MKFDVFHHARQPCTDDPVQRVRKAVEQARLANTSDSK
jgi:hypothetical protein